MIVRNNTLKHLDISTLDAATIKYLQKKGYIETTKNKYADWLFQIALQSFPRAQLATFYGLTASSFSTYLGKGYKIDELMNTLYEKALPTIHDRDIKITVDTMEKLFAVINQDNG